MVDAEAHAHGFPLVDVGVLPHDHDLEVCIVSLIEGIKDEVFWREDGLRGVLSFDEPKQVAVACTV